MFVEAKPVRIPDYLLLSSPRSVLRFIFAGVPRRFLRCIRHLRIQFDFSYEPRCREHEVYLIAVRIVLRIVPELVDLVFLWNNVPSRVFEGVSFKLEALTCTMSMDGVFNFLATQSQLRLLELPNWNSIPDSVVIPQSFVPGLSELSVPVKTATRLVTGRPVRSVDLRIAEGQQNVEIDWNLTMQALATSQSSLDDLAIATLASFPLSILSSTAYHPHIRSLYFRVYAPEISTTDVFQWGSWRPFLSHLPHLETIKVEIDCRYMRPRSQVRFVIPTPSCIREWRRMCSNLTSVYIGLYAGDALLRWEQSADSLDLPTSSEGAEVARR